MAGEPVTKNNSWNISGVYRIEKLINGYVKVRELNLEGDKVHLHDVGIRNYPALQLQLEKNLRRGGRLFFSWENYFIKGNANLDQNIEYNGTIINGSKGIDVSPTKFYRLKLNYHGNLFALNDFGVQYIAGLVFDHTTFYLDGQIEPGSPRKEVYEQFGKQALPFPEAGVSARYIYNNVNEFNLDVSGSYIPKFKSFYKEGGNMYLQYSTFLVDLNYLRNIGFLNISTGAHIRQTHLFGESFEDTNDLKMTIAAVYLGVGMKF